MEDADAGTMIFGAATLRDRAETDFLAILEQLYDQYAHALYRYALALVSSADDAEDAVQEVFVRIARETKRLKKVENLKAYLYTATKNAAYSILRSRKRRNETNEEIPDLADEKLPIESIALQESFSLLPIEQREILVLKIYDELTFDEIARTIGVSINTAASRYRYGIDRLKRALEES